MYLLSSTYQLWLTGTSKVIHIDPSCLDDGLKCEVMSAVSDTLCAIWTLYGVLQALGYGGMRQRVSDNMWSLWSCSATYSGLHSCVSFIIAKFSWACEVLSLSSVGTSHVFSWFYIVHSKHIICQYYSIPWLIIERLSACVGMFVANSLGEACVYVLERYNLYSL